jgi:hypothetical protein
MRIPTAKGRGKVVYAQGEQQALKPTKESRLAIIINCGRPAIQRERGVLEQIPKSSLLLEKKVKRPDGTSPCKVRN